MAEARAAWAGMTPGLDASRLVFLDETWASTHMARNDGWAPRGECLVAAVPHGRWRITTFVGALRPEGFAAPAVIDGAMDGPTFLAYVRQVLAPTLREGDTLVMDDNLGVRKVAGVREAVEARGATLLYLPPYSPDLSPIELAFSKPNAFCAPTPSAPPKGCGPPSAHSSTASARTSAAAISATAATYNQPETDIRIHQADPVYVAARAN